MFYLSDVYVYLYIRIVTITLKREIKNIIKSRVFEVSENEFSCLVSDDDIRSLAVLAGFQKLKCNSDHCLVCD